MRAFPFSIFGAAEESRTLDLYLGKVSLYQLSYCRIFFRYNFIAPKFMLLNFWSGRRVSNSRPIPWQGIALPTELLPHLFGGASRSRTDLHGFAIRCITALLSRLRTTFTALEKPSFPGETGAAEESRTLDLYLGKVSLYQLSYCRVKQSAHYRPRARDVNSVLLFFSTTAGNLGPGHAHVISHRPQSQ